MKDQGKRKEYSIKYKLFVLGLLPIFLITVWIGCFLFFIQKQDNKFDRNVIFRMKVERKISAININLVLLHGQVYVFMTDIKGM
ncbi:MAG: hypothetical protein HQK51_21145, partial [Oligoflexia bacterium]|nr:hypothetical protein [Oligoflexia bacterium]